MMSDELKKDCCGNSAGEACAARSTAPIWIIVVTLLLLFVGGFYFDRHSGWFNPRIYAPFNSAEELEAYQPKSGEAAALARGKTVYDSVCGACHGADGLGKPGMAPTLASSEWVITKGINRIAHIPLKGINGPIKVMGKDWNMNMAAMGAALSDEDLAGLLTYIRGSWGNKATAVAAEDIKKIRSEMFKGMEIMTGEQLMKLPE
jgi:mono/diheme cytochrome c family protein